MCVGGRGMCACVCVCVCVKGHGPTGPRAVLIAYIQLLVGVVSLGVLRACLDVLSSLSVSNALVKRLVGWKPLL